VVVVVADAFAVVVYLGTRPTQKTELLGVFLIAGTIKNNFAGTQSGAINLIGRCDAPKM